MNKSFFHKFWSRFQAPPEETSGDNLLRQQLKKILDFDPQNLDWYRKAFTHPLFNRKDPKGNLYNYERLEFLGDAVLSLIISDYLFRQYPEKNEGQLSDIRAKIVNRQHLNKLGSKWHLRSFLPRPRDPRYGDNLEGNLVEALIGAIYMDKGLAHAKQFVLNKIIKSAVNLHHIQNQITSHKAYMIDWAQKRHKNFRFAVDTETAGDGRQIYHARFFVDNRLAGRGRAPSKKKAEEIAARNAYRQLVEKK